MEQRQGDHVHVIGPQMLMLRIDPRAPERIGMGPEHALGPRGGARGVLHAEGCERVMGSAPECPLAPWPSQVNGVGINRLKGIRSRGRG